MSSSDNISVLICDDSALMRNILGKIIEDAEGLTLAGKAMNGRFALEKLEKLNPDIILMDIEMPEMTGIEFLEERKKRNIQIPVVILSSIAKKGAKVTMDALALGASDFIMKPTDNNSMDLREIADHIVKTLIAYGSRSKKRRPEPMMRAVEEKPSSRPAVSATISAIEQRRPADDFPPLKPGRMPTSKIELVVIGISTGGPNALREVFKDLDADLPVPVLVVQHMPAGFTEEFARSLDRICPLEVKEAADGDIIKPGRILIAPGHAHLKIDRRKLAAVARLVDTPAVNGHRPSADVLFASAAATYDGRVLGVIMTGMGKDGARELGRLYNLGAITIGQDEESSIVYGMPRAAYEHGYIDYQLPLGAVAGKISELVKERQ